MSVARSRLVDLMKVQSQNIVGASRLLTQLALQTQCKIFSTTFNPEGVRTGNKILRQRLRGPALAAYYPRKVVTLNDLRKAYPELQTWNEKEVDRLESVAITKARGKGAPKKKRTAAGKFGKHQYTLSAEIANANISTESKKLKGKKKPGAEDAA